MKAPFRVAHLGAAHERSDFRCGVESLDQYLQRYATQDVRRRVASCFVALDVKDTVAGYYTLASASVLLSGLPVAIGKKLPRYPSVPAVRMGRLAVDHRFAGCGLGGALLADALDRVLRAEIAAYALLVDAKDDTAAGFYRHHGFVPLDDTPLNLFLPLATAGFAR